MRVRLLLIAVFLTLIVTCSARGGTPVIYELGADASFEVGCYPPCLCPIRFAPLTGSFTVTPITTHPSFAQWSIDDVAWTIHIGPELWPVTGSGLLTITSEVIVVQRLELDLAIEGGRVQHFDGLTVLPQALPTLDVVVSEGDMVCFDTVFRVKAVPSRLPCPADVDGDDAVTFDDLLALLSAWGPCGICAEDIDHDGNVNFVDLLAVLTRWGPCLDES